MNTPKFKCSAQLWGQITSTDNQKNHQKKQNLFSSKKKKLTTSETIDKYKIHFNHLKKQKKIGSGLVWLVMVVSLVVGRSSLGILSFFFFFFLRCCLASYFVRCCHPPLPLGGASVPPFFQLEIELSYVSKFNWVKLNQIGCPCLPSFLPSSRCSFASFFLDVLLSSPLAALGGPTYPSFCGVVLLSPLGWCCFLVPPFGWWLNMLYSGTI